MRLEEQVVSLELAKKLKELGVKQEGLFVWLHNRDENDKDLYEVWRRKEAEWTAGSDYIECAAFTVAELGEMLPRGFQSEDNFPTMHLYNGSACVEYPKYVGERLIMLADTEADARAKMLIYLIENGLVKP